MKQDNDKPLEVDIYYSNRDVTSLRWLSEIKNEIKKYQAPINFRFHELNSNYAKQMNISKELITLNDEKIIFLQLKNLINNHIE